MSDDSVDSSSALRHVPPQPSDEPQVSVCIDKVVDVEQISNGWNCQDEYSFDEYYRLRINPHPGDGTNVASKLVYRQRGGLAGFENFNVLLQ